MLSDLYFRKITLLVDFKCSNFYHPPTKLREGYVFSSVCSSFCLMWPLPMMHWAWLCRDPSPAPVPAPQILSFEGPPHPRASSNFFNLDLIVQGPPASTHPTGMLSSFILPFHKITEQRPLGLNSKRNISTKWPERRGGRTHKELVNIKAMTITWTNVHDPLHYRVSTITLFYKLPWKSTPLF